MVDKHVVILRGGDINTYLKVPGLFCLYFDSKKLKKTNILTNDVPLFLEIQYNEDELPKDKYVFNRHSFDPKKGKLNVDHNKKSKAPKDILRAEFINNKRTEIMILLSVFTDIYTFRYPQIQGWFLESKNDDFNNLESKYGQLFYSYSFTEEDKNIECLHSINNEEYFCNRTILTARDIETGRLINKITISDMYRYYYESPNKIQEAVRNAARLYYQSRNHFDVDLASGFVYLVIALESLIQVEYDKQDVPHCDECKQPIFAVSKKFHAFLEKYYDDYQKTEISKIYSLRSSIVHRGFNIVDPSFFLFEDSLKVKEKLYKNKDLISTTRHMTRSVINKFLFYNKEGQTAPNKGNI